MHCLRRGPHGKVERHSGIGYELVLALDAPVLQIVEQPVVDVFARYAIQVPVQVIEVLKILIDVIPARSLVPEPQVVEQLVDVPTVLTPTRIALQIAEQLVDIPVPQVSVSGGGHQGFSLWTGFGRRADRRHSSSTWSW